MRVLFLTHRLPYPLDRGDRIRAFHILRTLAAEVELISLVHGSGELAQVDALRSRLGVPVTAVRVPYYRNRLAAVPALAGPRPLTHVLLNSPAIQSAIAGVVAKRPPDVVLAYCSSMAQFALQPPLSRFPLVLDLVDVDSAKWKDLADSTAGPLKWIYRREAKHLRVFEQRAITRSGLTLVVNEREAATARSLAPGAQIDVLRVGVDVAALRPRGVAAERPTVVFCGVMNYPPNVQGMLWFAREVWPVVRKGCPKTALTIVGADPVAAIRALASAKDGIEVAGRVSDVTGYLWNAAISVAPLRVARGVQNKVLEAVAAGLPAVVTPAVFDGLPTEIHPACRVAASNEEFAGEVIRLLMLAPDERRAIAAQANTEGITWEAQMRSLRELMAASAAAHAPGRDPRLCPGQR